MTDNPKSAVDSILEAKQTNGETTIYPLTLGRYALLELVESPFVNKDMKFSTLALLPTFYIMTHTVEELKGYTSKNIDELKDKALEWADSKDIGDSASLISTLISKFELVNKVAPDSKEQDTAKKKRRAQTDGQQA